MPQLKHISLMITVICAYSCGDCIQIGTARVLDGRTQKPIGSVTVFKSNRPVQNTLTDDNGKFKLQSISGGLINCPLMTVILNKTGYQTKTVDVSSDSSAIIYLDSIR